MNSAIQSTSRTLVKMPCHLEWLLMQEEEEDCLSTTTFDMDCDHRWVCRTTNPSQTSGERKYKCNKCKKSHCKPNKSEGESSKKQVRKCTMSSRCKDAGCVNCSDAEVVITSVCRTKCNDPVTISHCAHGCCPNPCTADRKSSSNHSSSSKKCKHQDKSGKNACSIHGCLETTDCIASTRICGCSVCHRTYNKYYADFMKHKNENAKRAPTKKKACPKYCKNGCSGCGRRH